MKTLNIFLKAGCVIAASMLMISTSHAQISSQSEAGIILSAPQTIQGLPLCDGVNDLMEQPLGAFGTAATSDVEVGFEVIENRTVGAVPTAFPNGNLGTARIWGLSLEFDPANGFVGPCSDDDNTGFVVATYADNAGQPGAQISAGTATATTTDTGTPFALGANILQIDLNVTGVTTDGATWLSFTREQGNNTPSGNACLFLHVNETDAALFDNTSFQFNANTPLRTDDMSVCAAAGAVVTLPPPPAVPTMNSFGLLGMALALMLGAGLFLRRRA